MTMQAGVDDGELGGIRYELPVYYRGLLEDVPGALVGADPFDGSVASPFAVLWESVVDGNIAAMQEWCAAHGVEIAPHGKTTMSPDLFAKQLAGGAWGITVASPAQARVALAAGARRVFIANQVTDVAGIRWLGLALTGDPGLDLYCYVDSVEGVRLLDRGLRGRLPVGTRLDVLLEIGVPAGRTGLRDDDAALEVAAAVRESSWLQLAGVSGYEGVPGGSGGPDGLAAVDEFCTRLRTLADRLVADELVHPTTDRPLLLSAGGSSFFDHVVAALTAGGPALDTVPTTVVLRSGAYVAHDHGRYARVTPRARGGDGPALDPAFEVWGRVLSRPEPTRAVVDVGRRDAPFDQDLPIPLWRRTASGGGQVELTATTVELNDQHCFLDVAAEEELAVGEWVGLGISHPCTAFDKWNLVLLLDDTGRVVQELPTRF